MNRNRLLSFAAVLVGALVALAFFGQGHENRWFRLLYDLALLVGSLLLLARLPAPLNRERNLGWLFLGTLVYLVLMAGTQLFAAAVGPQLSEGNLRGWLLLLRLPLAFGLAWPLLAVLRFEPAGWLRRRGQVVAYLVVLAFLTVAQAPRVVLILALLPFLLFVTPMAWVRELHGRYRGWLILALLLLTPISFSLFLADIGFTPGETSLNLGVSTETAGASNLLQGSLLNTTKLYLGFYWALLPLQLLVGVFQGNFGIRIPIWLKLSFTYIFSSVLPGLLLVLTLAVAIYAGVGTMHAHQVRRLVQRDFDELRLGMEEPAANAVQGDSLAVALYEVREVEPDSGAEQQSTLRHYWFLLEQRRGPWTAPENLPPLDDWGDASSTAEGLLPIGGGRIAMARAQALAEDRIELGLIPLNEERVRSWADQVGTRVLLLPNSVLGEESGDEGSTRIRISDGRGIAGEEMRSLRSHDGADEVESIFDQALYHGVVELHRRPGDNGFQFYSGQIVVQTTLRELFGSLYETEGLSRITLIVLGVLSGMLLFAILFSSLLGFGITRSITSSVKALRRGTERIREGDLEAQIKLQARDELGDLADSFNQMTADLRGMLVSMAEKERLEREIQIARQIQLQLLPKTLPSRARLDIGARSDPAQQVGGDYYDAIDLGERGVLIALGDVSGKGVGAAILMSNLQANLHVLASQGLDLQQMTHTLNRQIWQNSTPEMFITFFLALLSPDGESMSYVNAGHDTPFLLREGELIDLDVGGLLLGVVPDVDYDVDEVAMRAGDLVVCHSDGLTEAMDEVGIEFGRERLADLAEELSGRSAKMVVDGMLAAVRRYAGLERAGQDDLTALAVKIVKQS